MAVASGPPDPPRSARRLLRRSLVAVAPLLALLLAAALSSPWWFNAGRVADFALAQAGASTGLNWSYEGQPALRWRPRPWLTLPGLRIEDAEGRALLTAEQLDIALPWSTLRGEALQVDALKLTAPDIDLAAAIAWWQSQPASDGSALPQLDGLVITRGRLRWPGGRLHELELTLPRFAVGQPLALQLAGRVTHEAAQGGAPFALSAALDALPRPAPLRLDGLELRVDGTGPIPSLIAGGTLQFAPWALDAQGEIAAWPSDWPALPPPLSNSISPLAFTLTQRGESAMTAGTGLLLSRDEHHVEAHGTADRLAAWLDDANAAALPPLRVHAMLPLVEIDGARLEGVTIDLDDDAEQPAATGMPEPTQ